MHLVQLLAEAPLLVVVMTVVCNVSVRLREGDARNALCDLIHVEVLMILLISIENKILFSTCFRNWKMCPIICA